MNSATSNSFWAKKCVVITGASSGIGRALAFELGRRGALVGLIARNAVKLDECRDALAAQQIVAASAMADVTDALSLRSAVSQLEAQLAPCEVAIASAGVYRKTNVTNYDPSIANGVLNTNVLGVSNLFAVVSAGMIERRRGNLVAISSLAGLLGLPGGAAYCASKAAVSRLCDSLRVDFFSRGIRVTSICPGFVDTPMITDEDRAKEKHIVTAPEAAQRIAWAIERGRAEYSFPWQTWLEAKLASLLPFSIYRHVMKMVGEMEENTDSGESPSRLMSNEPK